MTVVDASAVGKTYDLVVIGTGFGSLFFAHKWIQRRPHARILMIERGGIDTHAWQVEHDKNSAISPGSTFKTGPDKKVWNFTIGFGGGTNCWFAQTPRMLPSDFELKSRYGVGQDWPISYGDLAPYYDEAEEIMEISGPSDNTLVSPRSRPYPQPPHRFSTPDEIMKAAQPDRHFVMPTARARIAARNRPACCDSARCGICPVDAKFTAHNSLRDLTDAPQVSILLAATVERLELQAGRVAEVVYRIGGRERSVRGDLVVLGANGIHSPAILLRSGIEHPLTGRGINEQVGLSYEVLLDGVDNFDGSTITTGLNYSLYDGESRREAGAALIYFENRWVDGLRPEFGRWRQSLPLTVSVEDLLLPDNRVTLERDGMPLVSRPAISDYAKRGVDRVARMLPQVLAPLPVEAVNFKSYRPTESHLQGSLRFGRLRGDSVVDAGQVHHDVRNLVVVGSAVFPSCPSVNPSLTVAALSLRAADTLLGAS